MSDNEGKLDPAVADQVIREAGLSGFMEQIGTLQQSLTKVAEGMDALGQSALRQGKDTENLAAHLLAIESVLTVVLRHIPIDMSEVRAEAERRTSNMQNGHGAGPSVVVQLAEDLVRRAED